MPRRPTVATASKIVCNSIHAEQKTNAVLDKIHDELEMMSSHDAFQSICQIEAVLHQWKWHILSPKQPMIPNKDVSPEKIKALIKATEDLKLWERERSYG